MQAYSDRDDVIYYLISRLYSLKKLGANEGFTRKLIFKVLYKLSRSLPKDDPFRVNLPYYWYFYGTVSDPVDNCIAMARYNGWMSPVTGKYYLSMTSEFPKFCIEEPDAERIDGLLSDIFKKVDLNNLQPFYESIYRDYAPNKFMVSFGLDFTNAIGVNIRDDEYDDFVDGKIVQDIDNIRSLISSCEYFIPREPIFKEYKYVFSTYVVLVERALDYVESAGKDDLKLFRNIRLLTQEVWKEFIIGNATLKNSHDEEYETKVCEWKERFDNNLPFLKQSVNSVYDHVFKEVKDGLQYELQDDMSRRIMASMIEAYLTQ
jgi:hypothetical protein